MKFLTSLLLTLLLQTALVAQYREITLPFPDTTRFKMQFVDRTHGWVCSPNGSILRTTDGGLTWTEHRFEHDSLYHDIQFVNRETGWIWVRDCQYVNQCYKQKLYRTTDGGNTWERRPFPDSVGIVKIYFPGLYASYRPHCIYFLGRDRVVFEGVRDIVDSTGRPIDYFQGWYSTSDGGETWDTLAVPRMSGYGNMFLALDSKRWIELYYQSPTDIPSTSLCFLSTDAGQSWTETARWFDVSSALVLRINDTAGVIINHPQRVINGNDSPAFITQDGGGTWLASRYSGLSKLAVMPTDTTFWAIYYPHARNNWMEEGELRRISRNDPTLPVNGRLMIPDPIRWISNVGETVFALSSTGKLFEFDDRILSDVAATPKQDRSFRLEAIHPNPFRSSAQVRYTLSEGTNISISLFDRLGRFVKEILPPTNQDANSYTMNIEAHDLASGLYFLMVQTDRTAVVKPMVCIR